MKRVWTLAMLALLLVASVSATAAGPSETPPTTPGTPTRLTAQTGYAGSSETTISGMVVDKDGRPLVDVAVKLYMGGLLVSDIMTSTDGSFEIVELIDYGRDVTIDMWFVPGDTELVMENVILKESSSAIQNGLYSKCVKRVRLDPITDFVVKVLDLKTRTRMLSNSDCLG